VRDTGIGMTEPRSASCSTPSPGRPEHYAALRRHRPGLAITKRLIELMGGQIAVNSRPGQGSTFWFSLPFEIQADQSDERRKPALGQLRLLVADDNRTSRELVARLIRAWGWQADEVDSGEAALRRYRQSLERQQPYDVVLADWHMPGMDGLATAKGIRAAANGRPQPIVVMLNAFARDRIEEISSAEADVVLVKPITSSNLFDALHQALATQGEADRRRRRAGHRRHPGRHPLPAGGRQSAEPGGGARHPRTRRRHAGHRRRRPPGGRHARPPPSTTWC
jgi:CheY-like chemotaxis protein